MERKKIIEYLPEFVQKYREIKEITGVEQDELDRLTREQTRALDNTFVADVDEVGAARYEKMLGIIKNPSANLDERKFSILVKMNEQLPYTITFLKNRLDFLCGKNGYSITLDTNNYMISVKIELTAISNVLAVEEMLERILPCNLISKIKVIYNQHITLAVFKHNRLAAYTYSSIRNEVITNGN